MVYDDLDYDEMMALARENDVDAFFGMVEQQFEDFPWKRSILQYFPQVYSVIVNDERTQEKELGKLIP